jgi:hypothetical protein
MTDVTHVRGWSPGRITTVAVLTVIGILAVIAAIMYLSEPARSLPAVLGTITHPASRANAHRPARGWVALAIGVICLAVAGYASRTGKPARR